MHTHIQVQVNKQVITVRKTLFIGVKPVTLDMELRPVDVTFAGNSTHETHTLVFGNSVAIYDVGQVNEYFCVCVCVCVRARVIRTRLLLETLLLFMMSAR